MKTNCTTVMFSNKVHNIEIRGSEVDSKWDNLLEDVKRIVNDSFPLKESRKKYLFTMSAGLQKVRTKKINYCGIIKMAL